MIFDQKHYFLESIGRFFLNQKSAWGTLCGQMSIHEVSCAAAYIFSDCFHKQKLSEKMYVGAQRLHV